MDGAEAERLVSVAVGEVEEDDLTRLAQVVTEECRLAGVEAHVRLERTLVLRWVQRPRGEALLDEIPRVIALDHPMGDLREAEAQEIAVGDEG